MTATGRPSLLSTIASVTQSRRGCARTSNSSLNTASTPRAAAHQARSPASTLGASRVTLPMHRSHVGPLTTGATKIVGGASRRMITPHKLTALLQPCLARVGPPNDEPAPWPLTDRKKPGGLMAHPRNADQTSRLARVNRTPGNVEGQVLPDHSPNPQARRPRSTAEGRSMSKQPACASTKPPATSNVRPWSLGSLGKSGRALRIAGQLGRHGRDVKALVGTDVAARVDPG